MHFFDFVLKILCVFILCSNCNVMGSSVKDDVYDFLFKGQFSVCCIASNIIFLHIYFSTTIVLASFNFTNCE